MAFGDHKTLLLKYYCKNNLSFVVYTSDKKGGTCDCHIVYTPTNYNYICTYKLDIYLSIYMYVA